jgi:hypothetical protein
VSDIATSSTALMNAAKELDEVSKALIAVEQAIEIQEPQVEDKLEAFYAVLWEDQEERERKMPPADVRERLAWRALDEDLKQAYRRNLAVRRRCKSRLADLREIVAAHRSIVSAAKTEMEATEGPQPHWTNN